MRCNVSFCEPETNITLLILPLYIISIIIIILIIIITDNALTGVVEMF